MKIFKFSKVSKIVLAVIVTASLVGLNTAFAATGTTLVASTNYSVLGATTVTNTGATTTTGEVGVYAGSAITGFDVPGGPGVAAGSNTIHVHRTDTSAFNAQADNLVAFGSLNAGDNAACLKATDGSSGSDTDGTNLGGRTLVPGVYCSLGAFQLTGTLTLTGVGPWVFKTVSGLSTATGSTVSVPTLADACNVWWRVGSSATLGTTTAFKGNILAYSDISLATGANLVGRAFARTGAVTLAGNTITGCAAPLVSSNLTLDKKVVGGSALESAWTLTAAGPMTLSGPGAAGSTDVVGNVSVGTYTLSESTGPSWYNASSWSCTKNGGSAVVGDSIVLVANDTAVCTITNTYHAPSSGSSVMPIIISEPIVFNPAINIIGTPIIPKLPKTGFPPQTWYGSLLNNILNLFR